MNRPRLLGAGALCAVVVALPAYAASEASVSMAPLVAFLAPYVLLVVQALLGIMLLVIANALQKYLGVRISQSALDKIRAAAATQAGVIVAGAADNLARQSVTIAHPQVADSANWILRNLPSAAKAAGATPEAVQHIIVGEIGKLQAVQPAGTPR